MILVEIDQNIIISEPIRLQKAGELTKAYQALMKRLKRKGITPKNHILDNECSQELKDAILENEAEYELVPKGQHRRNIAERGIQTWKSHAIGVFSGFPMEAPLFLWDEMLPQIDMQVNLLRFSNVNPTVCSNTVLNSVHNFNRQPLASLGIDMHMLEHPDKRKSWGVKGKKGTYIGTTLEHYRYYYGWFPETRGIRGSETVKFKHKYITNPGVTPADAIVHATKQLTDVLRGNIPPPLVKSDIDTLKQITNIFGGVADEYDKRAKKATAEEPAKGQAAAAPPRVEAKPPRVPAAAPRVRATPPRVEEV